MKPRFRMRSFLRGGILCLPGSHRQQPRDAVPGESMAVAGHVLLQGRGGLFLLGSRPNAVTPVTAIHRGPMVEVMR